MILHKHACGSTYVIEDQAAWDAHFEEHRKTCKECIAKFSAPKPMVWPLAQVKNPFPLSPALQN